MLIENLAWFAIGAGSMALVLGVITAINLRIARKQTTSAFDEMINNLKQASAVLSEINNDNRITDQREISELSFRDINGKLNTVRIIIDPSLTDDNSPALGSKETDEFIFSVNVLQKMRDEGIEPDEFVTNILKANGRMP